MKRALLALEWKSGGRGRAKLSLPWPRGRPQGSSLGPKTENDPSEDVGAQNSTNSTGCRSADDLSEWGLVSETTEAAAQVSCDERGQLGLILQASWAAGAQKRKPAFPRLPWTVEVR